MGNSGERPEGRAAADAGDSEAAASRPPIVWRLHLAAAPAKVFALLATDEGRRRFWAEESEERDALLALRFPNGERLRVRLRTVEAPRRFGIDYFDGSLVTFELADAPGGGTELTLTETGVPEASWAENRAGWVSVLLNLKAVADFGIDLRNHDPQRTWDAGFVDN